MTKLPYGRQTPPTDEEWGQIWAALRRMEAVSENFEVISDVINLLRQRWVRRTVFAAVGVIFLLNGAELVETARLLMEWANQ